MRKFLCLTVFTALLSTSALAETPAPEVDYSSISAPLMKMMLGSEGEYKEGYLFLVLRPIRTQGRSKVSIDKEDVVSVLKKSSDNERRRQVQQYLQYDLNFDGIVTEQEALEYLESQFKQSNGASKDDVRLEHSKKQVLAGFASLDSNNDRSLNMQEMSVVAKRDDRRGAYAPDAELNALLQLDPNKDGVLTVAELTELAEKAFSIVDQNGDGQLSQDERKPIRQLFEQERRSMVNVGPQCSGLPKVDAADKIVYLSAYEGKSLSSVSVAGQMEDTDVIPVVIEEGQGMLYIIASSFSPVIWQFSGATSRISKVIAAGNAYKPTGAMQGDQNEKIKSGVIGVNKDKISFVDANACALLGNYGTPPDRAVSRVNTVIERHIGRKPDMSLEQYGILTTRVGAEVVSYAASSKVASAPDGFDKETWARHIQSMPGGVVTVQKESVVSDVPAEDYLVLPKWAGISKLVGSGALVPIDRGFKIVKPIPYFPTGLHGGYSSYFLLGKGVPMPQGKAGHSCVRSEETGKVVQPGVYCERGTESGISIDAGSGQDLIIIKRQ